jgi:hypothetical protein
MCKFLTSHALLKRSQRYLWNTKKISCGRFSGQTTEAIELKL